MRALVIGGEGAIGAAVVRSLLDHGDEVVSVDIVADPAGQVPVADRDRYTYVRGDVTSAEGTARLVVDAGCDVIVHLASLLGPETAAAPGRAHVINLDGTVNVLEAARGAGVDRVVTASSIAVFGSADRYGTDDPVDENTPPILASGVPLYAATKLYVEKLAAQYGTAHGLRVVGLRPSVVHGPGRKSGGGGAVMDAIEQGALERALKIPMAEVRVPLVHVDDVASQFAALARADDAAFTDHLFFNSGGESCTIAELVDLVNSIVPGAALEAVDTGERDLAGLPARATDRALVEAIGYHRRLAPLEVAIGAHIAVVREAAGLPALSAAAG